MYDIVDMDDLVKSILSGKQITGMFYVNQNDIDFNLKSMRSQIKLTTDCSMSCSNVIIIVKAIYTYVRYLHEKCPVLRRGYK